jgi:hypothetical protein
MASIILLFPHPLGPTTALIPGLKGTVVLSVKDLNPTISMRFRNINNLVGFLAKGKGQGHYDILGKIKKVPLKIVEYRAVSLSKLF